MWFSEAEVDSLDLQEGDIVIVEGGAGYGRSALINKPLDGWGFQNSIVRVRPNIRKGHSPYIRYALQLGYDSKMIELECFTATLPHFTAEKVSRFRIPLPDLPTQRRIADYLDRETAQIGAMAEALDGLVARLEERRRGLFKTATGDTRQASLAVISRITLGKMLDGKKNKGIPTPYIRAANVERTGKIDTDDLKLMKVTPAENATYSLRADDIIMVEGGDAGRVGYVNQDLPGIAFQKTVMRIRCHTKYSFPRYVYYALDDAHKSGRISLDYSLSTIPHFPAEKAARLEIPLPPLDEQRRIAAHLDAETAKIDAMIAKAGELRALLDERRSALITATVTGQHPVPEEP
ncbi:restriction endonuclease S subunit [Corynebacterium uterequi]|uniref:Restriction endonuclease S subunit n=2 Tax=Corynebacterium uterequi TaxID=1072256 RepID=A0A0G3HK42_9CORY|nr:restriction endonuclease S subunit [Corynebacterium uterequi]